MFETYFMIKFDLRMLLQVHYGVPFGRAPKVASPPQKQSMYRAQSAGKSIVTRQDSFDGVSF